MQAFAIYLQLFPERFYSLNFGVFSKDVVWNVEAEKIKQIQTLARPFHNNTAIYGHLYVKLQKKN